MTVDKSKSEAPEEQDQRLNSMGISGMELTKTSQLVARTSKQS